MPNQSHFGAYFGGFSSILSNICGDIFPYIWLLNNMMDWMSFIRFFQFKRFDYNFQQRTIDYYSVAHELWLKIYQFCHTKNSNHSERCQLMESIGGCYCLNIHHKFLMNVFLTAFSFRHFVTNICKNINETYWTHTSSATIEIFKDYRIFKGVCAH